MSRQDNVGIFERTREMYLSDPELMEAVKASISRQKVYATPPMTGGKEGETTIKVTKRRSFEAASYYTTGRTAVLNFASARNPGGGVEGGSSAQEEALCRASTLYPCLCDKGVWADFYGFHRRQNDPVYSDRVIYTPDVVVFRNDDRYMDVLQRRQWWKVDVISCAAPNRGAMEGRGEDVSILPKVFEDRFRAILSVAEANGADNVVLGAFGCGVFGNDPSMVASSAKVALKDFSFSNVEFAVYCTEWDRTNFEAFDAVFADRRLKVQQNTSKAKDKGLCR